MADNKLVKTLTDAAVVTGITAGIGYIGKKMLKESFTGDPSSNIMNYVKMTAVITASIATKDYLEASKIIPK